MSIAMIIVLAVVGELLIAVAVGKLLACIGDHKQAATFPGSLQLGHIPH